MPMDFKDMPSLEYAAKVHKFREPKENESEEEFRFALHNHVNLIDRIESFEILFGVGWNRWTDEQKQKALFG